jgi:hypothetical protein
MNVSSVLTLNITPQAKKLQWRAKGSPFFVRHAVYGKALDTRVMVFDLPDKRKRRRSIDSFGYLKKKKRFYTGNDEKKEERKERKRKEKETPHGKLYLVFSCSCCFISLVLILILPILLSIE